MVTTAAEVWLIEINHWEYYTNQLVIPITHHHRYIQTMFNSIKKILQANLQHQSEAYYLVITAAEPGAEENLHSLAMKCR